MDLKVKRCKNLKGVINVPGDKSITHRALIIGSISKGKTIVTNYSNCKDCLTTLDILRKSGVKIDKSHSEIIVYGKGFEGLKQYAKELNCKNSGTTMRLLTGVFSTLNYKTILTGDSSLSRRPMNRIISPLKKMGADIESKGEKGTPPLIINGKRLKPFEHILKIPSAQVKSALILAGLNTEGETSITEFIKSRDHTERLLQLFGDSIYFENNKIIVKGNASLSGQEISMAGDISSASYFIALAVLIEDSDIIIKNVGINKTRMGFIEVLNKMGANIDIENRKIISNEPVGDIIISGKQDLKGIVIEKNDIPKIIDELPLLAVVATQARGETIVRGAEELRVKESDRIKSITNELRKMGANIEEMRDGFIINGITELRGSYCESYEDHRIAMSLTIAGLIADGESIIKNTDCIDISFPGFINYFKELNCHGFIGV